MIKDLTVVYYTANNAPESFMAKTQEQLLKAIGDTPLISVSQKPMDFGENICVGDIGCSTVNIYKQSLIGAKAAKTKYIAMAEDDALYTPSHFEYRPTPGVFAYDENCWGIYTWTKPLFTYKGRRVLWALVCERELYIKVMEERFAKYPNHDVKVPPTWGEPGRYERQLGVTLNKTEYFFSKEPSVVFSHPKALGFLNLGKRKRLGINPTEELAPWGKAEDILKFYQ